MFIWFLPKYDITLVNCSTPAHMWLVEKEKSTASTYCVKGNYIIGGYYDK